MRRRALSDGVRRRRNAPLKSQTTRERGRQTRSRCSTTATYRPRKQEVSDAGSTDCFFRLAMRKRGGTGCCN
jgi:hypothetical protein